LEQLLVLVPAPTLLAELPLMQKKNTWIYMPKPLGAIYGQKQAWSFGGAFLT
jgi:hypothetical protein